MAKIYDRKIYDKRYKEKNDTKLRYRKYRDELSDSYVAVYLSKQIGISVKEIRQIDGLIEAERLRLKLKRKLKQMINEK